MSPPNDLGRLGYPPPEFDRLTFEFVLQILRSGGRVLYGGHIHEGSLALKMFEYLASAYGSGSVSAREQATKPFLSLLAGSELRKTRFEQLTSTLETCDTFVEMRIVIGDSGYYEAFTRFDRDSRNSLLNLRLNNGNLVQISSQDELDSFVRESVKIDEATALTEMRKKSIRLSDARIVLGGRRGDLGVVNDLDRFAGSMPGIYEEVIQSLGKTSIVLLGAFGGAARDIACDLEFIPAEDRVPFVGEKQDGVLNAREELMTVYSTLDDRVKDSLRLFANFASRDDTSFLARDVIRRLSSIPTV